MFRKYYSAFGLIVGLLSVGSVVTPTTASAMNYEVLPTGQGKSGNKVILSAIYLDHVDNKAFHCVGTYDNLPANRMALQCSELLGYAQQNKTGAAVDVSSVLSNVAVIGPISVEAFWEVDQKSGMVQVCTTGSPVSCSSIVPK